MTALKPFSAEACMLWLWVCFLCVVRLTQFAKELHSQRSVDEEEQHEEETKISNLQAIYMLIPLRTDLRS